MIEQPFNVEQLLRENGLAYVELESKFFGKNLGYGDWIDTFLCDIEHVTFEDDDPKGIKVSGVVKIDDVRREYVQDYGGGNEAAASIIGRARRNSDRTGWIPASKATITRHDGPASFRVFDGDDSARGRASDADIVIRQVQVTRYGNKLILEAPYEAKDDIKSLDWDDYHPSWDGSNWTTDDAPLSVATELADDWTVAVSPEVMDNESTV